VLHTAPIETTMWRDALPLVEHMARNEVNDGMPRTPGSVIITTLGSAWIVTLVDPDRKQHITVPSVSLDHALMTAAELLRGEAPPWSDGLSEKRK